jgi:hypothetical protein
VGKRSINWKHPLWPLEREPTNSEWRQRAYPWEIFSIDFSFDGRRRAPPDGRKALCVTHQTASFDMRPVDIDRGSAVPRTSAASLPRGTLSIGSLKAGASVPLSAPVLRRRGHHSLVVATSTGLVTAITLTPPLTFCDGHHTLAQAPQVEETAPFARDQSHILDGEVGRISRNQGADQIRRER